MSKLGRARRSQAWVPSKSWSETFARECTAQLYEEAHRFAAWRARAVGNEGGLADEYYTHELVQNALADTAIGVLRWNPEDKPLKEHLWDAIRTRTNHDRMRARRYRHEAIDVFDPEASVELIGEIEVALAARTPSTNAELALIVADCLAELREHAAPSSDLARMLDAFAAGATTMADVMHITGMSEKEYDATRARLDRLLERLSARPGSPRRAIKRRA